MKASAAKSKTIIEQLNWRYAVKKYDATKKISDAEWEVLEESLLLAPSSMGLQAYKFVVITDQATKEKLKAAAFDQPQIADASHIVVFAYKKTFDETDAEKFIERIAEVRGQTRDSLTDYEKMINSSTKRASDGGYLETWNSRQPYIALGFLLETAALMGIDATPMEGFDPAGVNEILGLTDYVAVAIAAVGYRDSDGDWLAGLPKVRMPKEDMIERI